MNAEIFNNVATTLQVATVARGSGNDSITLGSTNPYISFANTTSAGVLETLDHTFTANGYITKLANQSVGTANPVMSGALAIGANSLTIALQDTNGDAQAELNLSGPLTGSGTLTLNNADATAGIGAPGTGAPDWGTLLISANNAGFSGPVVLTKGRLVVNNDNAAGTGLITVGGATNSGGVLSLGGNNGGGAANYGGLQNAATGFTLPNAINLGGETSGNYGQGLINNSGINTLSGVITLQQPQVNIQVNNASTLILSNSVGESAAGDSIVKTGNGLLRVNNATFTGTASAVNAGNFAFTGTAPTGGIINIGANGFFNIGTAGNSYLTAASALASGRIATTSAGTLALTGANPAIDLTGFGTLGLGATTAGADLTGTITAGGPTLHLGGGGGTLTVSGVNALNGPTTVQVIGGPVIINSANNFTGGLTLTNNVLTLGAPGAIGSIGPIFFGGGTLKFTAANTTDYSARFSTAAAQAYNFDTNGQSITFANGFTSTGGQLDKIGTGTLTLGNGTAAAFGTANLFVDGGTLVLASGATVNNTGYTSIGRLNGQTGILTLQGTAALTTTGDFNVSDLNTTSGTLNILGTGEVKGGTLYIGKNGSSTGVVNITGGGKLTQTGGGDTRIGGANNATDQAAVGIINLSNGTFTTPGNTQIGAGGAARSTRPAAS